MRNFTQPYGTAKYSRISIFEPLLFFHAMAYRPDISTGALANGSCTSSTVNVNQYLEVHNRKQITMRSQKTQMTIWRQPNATRKRLKVTCHMILHTDPQNLTGPEIVMWKLYHRTSGARARPDIERRSMSIQQPLLSNDRRH